MGRPETRPVSSSPVRPSSGAGDGPLVAVWPWWATWLLALVAPIVAGGLAVLAVSGPRITGFGGPVLSLLLSPVFVLVLGAELTGLGLWVTQNQPVKVRLLLIAPAVWVIAGVSSVLSHAGEEALFVAVSAFLVAWFVLVLQYVYRNKQLDPRLMRFLIEASVGASFVGAGWFLWALDREPFALVVGGLAASIVAVRAFPLARPEPAGAERVPWLLRPFWVFELLLFTFLAEFFVGALLDFEIVGPSFLQYIPFLPLSGALGSLALTAIYDGLWFGAAILASAWFLVALGFTMGSLVVFRLREVHVAAQRYRMVLMIGVFGLAAVFLPSFASSTPLVSNQTLASLPLIGWGFGLRDGGPFASGVFLAVIVMYASVGVLTVLFGRKALCSVMCGAAMLYQGSAVHEMRQFHQTSRVGRYFLGSRLTTAYAVASGMALVSLFAISVLAFLHDLPTVQVANGQFDTAALPLPIELYFGGIWFVLFVSTPYLGTYNCASTGFCHWGSLSIPFTKVSFFRLRVKDKKVCEACTTFDCAKSCPVGLVDMPLYFRTKGEYRSSKCCGVGDCVGACPYGNLYHQDVRFWLLRSLKRLSAPTPQLLPMAKAPPASATSPGTNTEAAGGSVAPGLTSSR